MMLSPCSSISADYCIQRVFEMSALIMQTRPESCTPPANECLDDMQFNAGTSF